MPFANMPEVRIGDEAEAWHQTVWDDALAPADVEAGDEATMSARDVQYLRWVVQIDKEPKRVCKLLVAGVAAPATPGVVATVAVGTHRTYLRARPAGSSEVRETRTQVLTVLA